MKIKNSITKVKNHTVHQIIDISRKIPVNEFEQAFEIAMVFRDQKKVHIPQGGFFYPFWQMVAALWCGGYIAGVQTERDRQNRTKVDSKSI